MTITITMTRGVASEAILEIHGPLPGDESKYGSSWRRYTYRVTEAGKPHESGEVHAVPEEGMLRLIERISAHARAGRSFT